MDMHMGDQLLAINTLCEENLDEEVEHPGEVLNCCREFSRDADCGCSTVDGTSNKVRKPTSTLKVEFGWRHYSTRKGKFFQVKGNRGGTWKADMERNSSYQDCLLKAIGLFFPNSSSPFGTLAEMETPYLANFKLHKYNEEGFTVGRFKEITKMNSPRIYLVTKPKTQTDSRPQRNSPSSDVLYGTEVNNVESSSASETDSGWQDLLSEISSDLDSTCMVQFLGDPNLSLMSIVDGQSPVEVTESTVQQGQVGTDWNGNSHKEDISLTGADLNTILPEITQDYHKVDHSVSTVEEGQVGTDWNGSLTAAAGLNTVFQVAQRHTHPSGSVETNRNGTSGSPSAPSGSDCSAVLHQYGDHYSGVSTSVYGILPQSGGTEGGYPFHIALLEPLPADVTSGMAYFGHVGSAQLTKVHPCLFRGTVPGSLQPGVVTVAVWTHRTGQHLGITHFTYINKARSMAMELLSGHVNITEVISIVAEQKRTEKNRKKLSDCSHQTKQQHSLQFLQLLVYTAAQTGEKQFIEIIFSTSAGQIVFDSYKDRDQLPEDVARANGHDDLANYLQDFTKRFSKEPECSLKEAHVIDWSELEAAATAAQTQGCVTEEKSSDDSSENNSDTDYFADVETSIDSSELSRSTSEDDTSEPYSREKTKASAHQSIYSIVKGAFAENGTMDKIRQNILEGVKQKRTVLILKDSHFDSSLPEAVKGLNYTLAFQLAMGSKNIPRHLHTANERFLASRENIICQPTISFCKLHPDVLIESSFVKNNNDHILRIDAAKQSNQLNEDIFAELRTQIEKAIPVEWKSSDISVKQFGAHTHCDLWVFTSAFRPTRKTLFVYFADRMDALPHSYFFEDEDCESQICCWKWKSENNSWKFTERLEADKLPPGEAPEVVPQQIATCLGLPEENPKIIGRGEDCEKITQTLTSGARIFSIVGPLGIGKTALAIAVGHMMKGQGKDIVYVSLRPVASVEAAAKKMLKVVGIPLARAPILQVQQYLTSLLKQTVLILDNAEDLQKEDGASFNTFLDAISKEATNVLTLVTSRILLSKLDYHITPVEYPLRPLTEEQSVVFLQNEGIPDQWATLFSRHKVCGGVPLLLKITASFFLKSETVEPHRSLHECKDEFLIARGIGRQKALARSKDAGKNKQMLVAAGFSDLASEAPEIVPQEIATCLGLPEENPKIIGRGEDCEKITQTLPSGARILLIVGPPGFGKTAVAIAVGHMMKGQGKDIVYVSLRTVTSVEAAAKKMLEVVGISLGRAPILQVQHYLTSLLKQTVLILDNAEDLQKEDGASFNTFLDAISKEATNVLTLVTSRILLSKLDYHITPVEYPLRPLTEEQSVVFLQNEGIPDQWTTLFSRHKVCGGVPLVLKITASFLLKSETVEPVELQRSLYECKDEFLREKNPEIQELHSRLGVFCNYLPSDVRKALSYLATFPTVFKKGEAKEVLFKEINPLDFDFILSALESHSLVEREEVDGCLQYSLHPLVQAFCVTTRGSLCGNKTLYSECQLSIGFKQLCFHGYKDAHRTNAITSLEEAHDQQKSLGIYDERRGHCECKLGLCTFVAGNKKKGISLIARGIGRQKALARSKDAGKNKQMLVAAGFSDLASETPEIVPQQMATCLGLPDENPKIIGRGEDCETITQTLTSGARILLIVGPPGIGKTAVAIAVGHMMKGQGKDIVYVSLRTVTSVEAAAKKMLEVVGIPLARGPILQAQQYLASLLKQTVLILDNAEDLQKEDGALFHTFLDAISKEATNFLTLVTSRILLSKLDYLITPVEYPLRPLTEEQSVVFLQNEGIPDQWATLFSRHKVCGGVPLLLKITASFLLKSETVEPVELHRSLHECKNEFLRVKNPEIQELHSRLGVFYNYLPSDVRKALSYLATFPTVFKKGEAKEVLFKEMKPLDFDFILSALESHSLVEREEVDGCLQYSLHPLVQAFFVTTRGSLCGNEYNMAIILFSQHYLRFLEQLNDDFISTDCKPAIDKYQLNKTNICHALTASKDGHLKHFGLHVSTKTVGFLAKCMNINEFMSVYGKLLSGVKGLSDKTLYSECQLSIGFKQLCFYGYKDAHRTNAITSLEEAHDLQKSLGIYDECRGHCECKLGLCTFVAGNKKKGISLIARGIGRRKTLAQSKDAGINEQMLVGSGFSDLAMAMYDSQKYKAAVNIWKNMCLVRYRRLLGTHPFTASVLDDLGNAYQRLGCPQKAVLCKKESLQMRCSLLGKDHLDTARAYYGLGCALGVLGSTEEALKNLSKAYRVQTRFHASPQDIEKTKRELDRLQEVVRLQKDRMPNHVAAIEEL